MKPKTMRGVGRTQYHEWMLSVVRLSLVLLRPWPNRIREALPLFRGSDGAAKPDTGIVSAWHLDPQLDSRLIIRFLDLLIDSLLFLCSIFYLPSIPSLHRQSRLIPALSLTA